MTEFSWRNLFSSFIFLNIRRKQLAAIYHALTYCKNCGFLYTTYTDSQASIDAINSHTRHNNVRSQIKYSNYDLLAYIDIELARINPRPTFRKVKGHSGLILNDLADKLALFARLELPEPTPYVLRPTQDTEATRLQLLHLQDDHRPICIYPRRHILATQQKTHHDNAISLINRRWAVLPPANPLSLTNLNLDLSIASLTGHLGQSHRLDASHVPEASIRLRILTSEIPTRFFIDKRNGGQPTACPRCSPTNSVAEFTGIPESIDHLFSCPITNVRYTKFRRATSNTLIKRLDSFGLLHHHIPSTNMILGCLGLTRNNRSQFFSSPIARGLITHEALFVFKHAPLLQRFPLFCSHRRLILLTAVGSIASAFYSVIWKHRCQKLKERLLQLCAIQQEDPSLREYLDETTEDPDYESDISEYTSDVEEQANTHNAVETYMLHSSGRTP